MESTFYRQTWAEINLAAIDYNIRQMKHRLLGNTGIIAVVKADAYGHGAIQVAKTALAAGARSLAVALLEEALVLREAGIEAEILVFGWVSPDDAYIAAEHDITLSFFQKQWLRQANQHMLDKKLKLHMKWDTGMGRVGIRSGAELEELVVELKESSRIQLTGIYTHFATADEVDPAFFREQNSRFKDLLTLFKGLWEEPVMIHTGNSAASIRFPEKMFDSVRFGIAMYGLYPSQMMKKEKWIDLKPAFSLHSQLIHTKRIAKGETVGYGRTYRAEEDEWIGTIPIGYADGWIRKLSGMDVLVDGQRMPIVGRICMDQTMIKLDREYPIGTKVTLIGKQGHEKIEMDEVATWLETINYEIPCTISSRVPRVHVT